MFSIHDCTCNERRHRTDFPASTSHNQERNALAWKARLSDFSSSMTGRKLQVQHKCVPRLTITTKPSYMMLHTRCRRIQPFKYAAFVAAGRLSTEWSSTETHPRKRTSLGCIAVLLSTRHRFGVSSACNRASSHYAEDCPSTARHLTCACLLFCREHR